jgi:hypothetical protein
MGGDDGSVVDISLKSMVGPCSIDELEEWRCVNGGEDG